jgi:hypothetical protein
MWRDVIEDRRRLSLTHVAHRMSAEEGSTQSAESCVRGVRLPGLRCALLRLCIAQ